MSFECRILDYNLCTQSNVAVSASSSNSEFPVSNLQKTIRSSVWRSSGNFVIDATNDKIDFKESGGGSTLVATLTHGTYTPAALATLIGIQMGAASGATGTYTVTYSASTGKWTIATSLAFLSILWNTGSNTAVTAGAPIGFDVTADATGATSYTGAKIAIHTEEWAKFDLGSATPIDSLALFFDPMRAIPFSSNALLYIQANATDSWASPSINQALTIDAVFQAASYFWSASQSYRYWRLRIVDPANTNLYAEVSTIVITKATQLGRVPKNGFTFTKLDQSAVQRTSYGHVYADLYPIQKQLDFEYGALAYADLKTLDSIFQRLGTAVPLVICMDDTETVFDKEHFLIYGTIQVFQPVHSIGSYFDQQFSFLESF